MTNQVMAPGPGVAGMPSAPFSARLRPQSVTQTPNVLIDEAKLYSPPTLGSYWSWLARRAPERVKPALKRATENSGRRCLIAWDAALAGLGVTTPEPQVRLQLYRRKAMELWIEQRSKFPWAFTHDWMDYEKLEGRLIPMPPMPLPQGAVGPQIPQMVAA
jgi:hypothetical protein